MSSDWSFGQPTPPPKQPQQPAQQWTFGQKPDPAWRFGQDPQPQDSGEGVGSYKATDPTPPDRIIAKYLPTISTVSKKYGVPDWVLKFVIGQESGTNTDPRIRETIRNGIGAAGIGQIMPDTAKGAGVDPLNWQQSLEYMGKALSGNYAATKDWAGAVAAYNMGLGGYQGAVQRGNALPLETRKYLANFGVAARNSVKRNQQRVTQAVAQGNQAPPMFERLLQSRDAQQAPKPAYQDPLQSQGAAEAELPNTLGRSPQYAGVPGNWGFGKPKPTPTPGSNWQFGNPMDQPDQTQDKQTGGGPGPIGGVISPAMAHSGLMEVAGHQDLPFILVNALERDNANLPSPATIAEQMRDPNSNVHRAWALYMRDPGQAMDEYGLGSPAQDQWMAKNRPDTVAGKTSAMMLKNPMLNALTTFGGEQLNPMAWAEGAIGGKALEIGGDAMRALGLDKAAQTVAKGVGLGSPLFDLRTRGGVEASQWAKGAISNLNAPHKALGLPSNKEMITKVFGGLTPEAQSEVVRLKQGLKPNPALQGTPIYRTGGPGAFYSKSRDFGVGGLTAKPVGDAAESFATARNPLRITPEDMEAHAIDKGDASQMAITYLGEHGHRVPGLAPGMTAAQRDAAVMAYAKRLGYDAIETPAEYVALDKSAVSETNPGADLARRAKLLGDDMAAVEQQQERVGVLPPERKFNSKKFFPMKGSYDFGPQAELEAELKGQGAPGGGGLTQHKVHKDLDESIRSGTLDEDFLASSNYNTWRRQRLQRVAFEDSVNEAPASIRRDVEAADFHNKLGVPLSQPWQRNINTSVGDTLDQWIKENNAHYPPGHPERYDLADNPQWVRAKNLMPNPESSPALAKSMLASEFWNFLSKQGRSGDTKFGRYINGTGTYLPGQEQTFVGKYIAAARNAIISNFLFHPAANIAGNDAVARGIYNLGGAQFGRGGYAFNAAKSLATQAGLVKPEQFVGGAQEYSDWLGRAMKAGGIAEFGEPRKSALGGDYARVLTAPSKNWRVRLDKALTKAGDFNRERTFGEKGEQAFAVSLFKDAVTRGGMSDAQAGEMVRQSLGDYYNFDPKSPWSSFFFFMPWLKGNMKFWVNTLVRRPQYVTSTPHALRNYGLATDPENYEGSYPTGDFTVPIGGRPYTPPFVGRDIGHLVEAGRQLASGQPIAAAAPLAQMLKGRANPILGTPVDLKHTIDFMFSPDMRGPETNDWEMIANPKAPPEVQFQQAGAYFATHFIPIPLFTYALQDAARTGMSKADLGSALFTAAGAGYFGNEKLDDATKRQVSNAQKQYKKSYDAYRYGDIDLDELRDAWRDYIDQLKDLGAIQ